MKFLKHLILIVIMISAYDSAFAETSFGILPMVSKNVSQNKIAEATTGIYQNLIDSKKYTIVNRQQIRKILKEQALQMSGATSQKKKVEMGRLLGIEKIISCTAYIKEKKHMAVSLNIIDVETGQVEFSKEIYEKNSSAQDLGRFTAAAIINEYPLVSNVLGKAGDIIVVNLGSRHGVTAGSRLFAARNILLRNAKGAVLFRETKRIALLRVLKVDTQRAQTRILRQVEPGLLVKAGDLVSTEPLPKQAVKISTKPLIKNYRKGKKLIDDDMEDYKYLSVVRNKGKAYRNDSLHLNSMANNAGHSYCYYSDPVNELSEFILQGEFRFQPIKANNYNKLNIMFLSNGNYTQENGYALFFNNIGQYEIDYFKQGAFFNLISIRNTPLLKRGIHQKNRFKIVARGGFFDVYLNGKFLAGFEDYTFERGTIGFKVNWGGYVTIDNVKIWKHRKQK